MGIGVSVLVGGIVAEAGMVAVGIAVGVAGAVGEAAEIVEREQAVSSRRMEARITGICWEIGERDCMANLLGDGKGSKPGRKVMSKIIRIAQLGQIGESGYGFLFQYAGIATGNCTAEGKQARA
ncbi:MAG: hypothetical protein OEZ02_10345 [Anaerolineae bacterium]|nr:hypothetical protein [Anaerolineae bacterium]